MADNPKNRTQTYNGLPAESSIPLRIVALEGKLEITQKKLLEAINFIQAIHNASVRQFAIHQHNHHVLVETLLKNNIISREQLDTTNEFILTEMKKKAEAEREAAEQKEPQDPNATDVAGQSGSEIGTGDSELEGVSGTTRRHLSAVPKPDGGSGNTH